MVQTLKKNTLIVLAHEIYIDFWIIIILDLEI